jgi:hypothetical protein
MSTLLAFGQHKHLLICRWDLFPTLLLSTPWLRHYLRMIAACTHTHLCTAFLVVAIRKSDAWLLDWEALANVWVQRTSGPKCRFARLAWRRRADPKWDKKAEKAGLSQLSQLGLSYSVMMGFAVLSGTCEPTMTDNNSQMHTRQLHQSGTAGKCGVLDCGQLACVCVSLSTRKLHQRSPMCSCRTEMWRLYTNVLYWIHRKRSTFNLVRFTPLPDLGKME